MLGCSERFWSSEVVIVDDCNAEDVESVEYGCRRMFKVNAPDCIGWVK